MPALGPEQLDAVVAACQAGAAEAAQALARGLDLAATIAVGEPGAWQFAAPPPGCAGPGLVLAFAVGNTGALLLVPEASGLLPPWYAAPDATGQSKLTTLAQELGMLLLPEEQMPEEFAAGRVGALVAACQRSGLGDGASLVPLAISAGEKTAQAMLVWPAVLPLQALAAAGDEAPAPAPGAAAGSHETPPAPTAAERAEAPLEPPPTYAPQEAGDLDVLPGYLRSRLRVRAPVVVTLASKRQTIGRILEIGPGSIVQFDKLCDEMLDLSVGNHLIARGEAVKIGEKFGLRITSLVLPEERFAPLKGRGERGV
jgi:flagellar motor switch/type III secretory pathway protein FliN